MELELTQKKTLCSCRSQGFLLFGSLSTIHWKKYARMALHLRLHVSIEAEFDSEHFQFWCEKLGLLTEEEFSSKPGIGFLSSSKSKFRDLVQYFQLGETMGKSNPSLTLNRKNPKILKLIRFVTFAISQDWRRIKS